MSEKKVAKNWFARQVEREAKKDVLPRSERFGSGIGVLAILLITLYFVVHQMSSTGFFTSKFGPAESLLFYIALLFGMIPAAARGVVGRKNVLRPLDLLECFYGVLRVSGCL